MRYYGKVRSPRQCGQHAQSIEEMAEYEDAPLNVPSPDHFLPLLYVVSQRLGNDTIALPIDSIEPGSISTATLRTG